MKSIVPKVFAMKVVNKIAIDMSDIQRYEFSVRQIVHHRQAWLLTDGDKGGATIQINDSNCICLWPSNFFAEAFQTEVPAVFSPKSINIDDLFESIEEMRTEENVAFAVFPTQKDVYVVTAEQFFNDLSEMSEYAEHYVQSGINTFLWNAEPAKRYLNFIHTVCDTGIVWLAYNGDDALLSNDSVMIWPTMQDVSEYLQKKSLMNCYTPQSIDIILFMSIIQASQGPLSQITFHVFATDTDGLSVNSSKLHEGLMSELEKY